MTDLAAPSTVPVPAVRPMPRRRRILRKCWRFLVSVLAVIGLISVLRPFTFDVTRLASGSMAPTLQGDVTSGDWVLSEKISYHFRNPRRWEVISFFNKEGLHVMKRVVAFPGESLAIKNNRLLINGNPIEPPAGTLYPKYYPYGNIAGGRTFPVPTGYYVLGDDSSDSEDSRFEGPVTPNHLEARAYFILWPPSRMGWIH